MTQDSGMNKYTNIFTNDNARLQFIEDLYTKPFKLIDMHLIDSFRFKQLREIVFDKYGTDCMCCGINKNKSNHIDHIIPLSIRPDLAYDIDNLQVLCKSCNSSKRDKTIDYR